MVRDALKPTTVSPWRIRVRGALSFLEKRPMNALPIYPFSPMRFIDTLKFVGMRPAQPRLGLMTGAALRPRM